MAEAVLASVNEHVTCTLEIFSVIPSWLHVDQVDSIYVAPTCYQLGANMVVYSVLSRKTLTEPLRCPLARRPKLLSLLVMLMQN